MALINEDHHDQHSRYQVSVIVVSFNTRDRLRECLRSVMAQRGVDAPQVIVVDNASADGSADMVRDEYPQIELIANQRNLGFAAGNNQALQHCLGLYILLLNPDTVLLQGSLEGMVSFMETHPDAGVVGAKLLNPAGALQPSCFRFPTLTMLLLDLFPIHPRLLNSKLNGRYPTDLYDTIFTIDHPLGACMMVRREAIDQVGSLDEGFFMYCEEVDWCFRMRQAGWRSYFLPTAQAIHFGGESTKQRRNEMFVELHRSRLRLFDKHRSLIHRLAARGIIKSGALVEAARSWWQAQRGQLPQAELQDRLRACRNVLVL